jgi:hypothetical protein
VKQSKGGGKSALLSAKPRLPRALECIATSFDFLFVSMRSDVKAKDG